MSDSERRVSSLSLSDLPLVGENAFVDFKLERFGAGLEALASYLNDPGPYVGRFALGRGGVGLNASSACGTSGGGAATAGCGFERPELTMGDFVSDRDQLLLDVLLIDPLFDIGTSSHDLVRGFGRGVP